MARAMAPAADSRRVRTAFTLADTPKNADFVRGVLAHEGVRVNDRQVERTSVTAVMPYDGERAMLMHEYQRLAGELPGLLDFGH